MTIVGVICEYNPFHNGHAIQIRRIREKYGSDCGVICLMSGNYVQRGEPALFHKAVRARAAILGGADLVLELPLTAALSSAEGFADGGVSILDALGCQALCFGCECGDGNRLMETARLLLDPDFDHRLRRHLESGCSYPRARELALRELGGGETVTHPNDILGAEYCKAILRRNSPMEILAIPRRGNYLSEQLDPEQPSATAVRIALRAERGFALSRPCTGQNTEAQTVSPDLNSHITAAWLSAVPSVLWPLYTSAPIYTQAAGERAMLARLRTLSDADFAALPYGAEGLWSKLMKNCRRCASVEEILTQTKSKRYTRTRLQRMLLCAYLGLTAEDLAREPNYTRILAFNDCGRALVSPLRDRFPLINAGQTPPDSAYSALEDRAGDLYELFSDDSVAPGGSEARQRIAYLAGL